MHVAVYGTLKLGFHNHYWLDGSRLLSSERLQGWQMWDLIGFPAVTKSTQLNSIEVEIYEVEQDTLRSLDHLEGYPHLYNRELIETSQGKQAWIYFMNTIPNRAHLIDNGIWTRN